MDLLTEMYWIANDPSGPQWLRKVHGRAAERWTLLDEGLRRAHYGSTPPLLSLHLPVRPFQNRTSLPRGVQAANEHQRIGRLATGCANAASAGVERAVGLSN